MPTTNDSLQSRKKLVFAFFILSLIIFVLACVYGAYKENHLAHTKVEIGVTESDQMISRYALAQYQHAEYSEAKAALNQYFQFLAQIKASDDVYSIDVIQRKTAINYARLAIIEEKHGNIDLAQHAWQQAEQLAQTSGLKEPTRTHLIALANVLQ